MEKGISLISMFQLHALNRKGDVQCSDISRFLKTVCSKKKGNADLDFREHTERGEGIV